MVYADDYRYPNRNRYADNNQYTDDNKYPDRYTYLDTVTDSYCYADRDLVHPDTDADRDAYKNSDSHKDLMGKN